MLEFKRAPRIKEDIKIGDDIISVDIDAEGIALEFTKRQNEIIAAELALKKAQVEGGDATAAMQIYGEAVVMLLGLIFGAENTEKIVAFYEGRYIELSTEVFPFIIDVVRPKILEAVKRLRKQAALRYR